MKTPDQQVTEWVTDAIKFRVDKRKPDPNVFSAWEFQNLVKGLAKNNGSELVNPDTRLMAVEITEWSMVDVIYHNAKERGIELTTQFFLQFDGLEEAEQYVLAQPKKTE